MRTRVKIASEIAWLCAGLALGIAGSAIAQTEVAKLVGNDAKPGWLIGFDVDVDGDFLVTGARGDDAAGGFSGSAYVYRRDAGQWHLDEKLTPPNARTGMDFGYSVAINNRLIVVGARGDDHRGNLTGSAFVYERTGDEWRLRAKLTAKDAHAGQMFGHAVDIDGDRIIVSARADNHAGRFSGSAYVFVNTPTGWRQEAKLTALDASANAWFGGDVAIDGQTVIVGAHLDRGAGGGTGAAYIFHREDTRWTQGAKLFAKDGSVGDLFGYAVDIVGDYAIAGAYSDNSEGVGSGAAYIFHRNDGGWRQQAKLLPRGGRTGDQFGFSVAMDGSFVLVAAPQVDIAGPGSGAAYIFRCHGDQWVESERIVASDSHRDKYFSHSVAINNGTAVVGARGDSSAGEFAGATYVFHRNPEGWSQEPKIKPPQQQFGHWFASAIAISTDHALVGRHLDSENGENAGAAFVFQRDALHWAPIDKIVPANPASGDLFGASVALDEANALVGAPGVGDHGPAAGAAYGFRRRGDRWDDECKLVPSDAAAGDRFGSALALDRDRAVIGALNENHAGPRSGSAYVFRKQGRRWVEEFKLTAADAAPGDSFGQSIDVRDEWCVVGAPRKNDYGRRTGAAYVFVRQGHQWAQQAKLETEDVSAGAQFGCAVALDPPFALIGAFGDNDAGPGAGAVCVFEYTDDGWIERSKLVPSDGEPGDLFGYSLDAQDGCAVISAHRNDHAGDESGAVYIFHRFGNHWLEQLKLTPFDAHARQMFGWAVAVDGSSVAVGAHFDDEAGEQSGAAYIFRHTPGTWLTRPTPTDAHAALNASP